MITIDCPWCDGTATVDEAADGGFACPECAASAPIVPDEREPLPAAA